MMSTANLPDTGEYAPVPAAPAGPPESVSTRVEVEFGAVTHPGLVRPTNEDCFLVGRVERVLETVTSNLPIGLVATRSGEAVYGMVVADGLGGSAAGEVASQLAISTLVNLVLHTPDWVMRTGDAESKRILDRIVERYRRIGAALDELAQSDPDLRGMATTMTLAASNGPDLFLGHVGDSRAYLFRRGDLFRLTHDHTYAQELADHGLIRQYEVDTHRLRHVLTRALGPQGDRVRVDVRQLSLRDEDQLLLCSDGLTGMVSERAIVELLGRGTAAEACQALVDAALDRGGKDNVTAVLARYRFPAAS
jgi:protein phosphatase